MQENKKILELLKSDKKKDILSAFEKIQIKGNYTYLPYIFDIYKNFKEEEIKNYIFNMLCNINNNENTKYIIDYIKKENYKSIKKDLLTICWNSRLDFSPYLSVFVDLFINEDFEIAFDAFTVIENIEHKYDKEIIDKEIIKLKDCLEIISQDKKELLVELVKILEA